MGDQLPDAVTTIVVERGDVRIHTFTSPEAFLANSTHIIEGPESLVIVDGQFVVPYAKQFRAYADGLGKPIDRVFLSHGHVDHFFGLGAAFADTEIYALAETIHLLAQDGESMRADRAKEYGPFVPEHLAIPQHEVTAGTTMIDGVTYDLAAVANTECAAQLTIRLPELGVYIAQDLIYSGAHLYVTSDVANWINVLHEVAESGCDVFLAGHGPVAGKQEVEKNAEYLTTARTVLDRSSDGDSYKAAMLAAYPDRTGAAIFDIYVPRLFAPSLT